MCQGNGRLRATVGCMTHSCRNVRGAARQRAAAGLRLGVADYCFGLYHLSSPAWASWPACSGVTVPLITAALRRHSSFSRFGSPRERIWSELRMVDLLVE